MSCNLNPTSKRSETSLTTKAALGLSSGFRELVPLPRAGEAHRALPRCLGAHSTAPASSNGSLLSLLSLFPLLAPALHLGLTLYPEDPFFLSLCASSLNVSCPEELDSQDLCADMSQLGHLGWGMARIPESWALCASAFEKK